MIARLKNTVNSSNPRRAPGRSSARQEQDPSAPQERAASAAEDGCADGRVTRPPTSLGPESRLGKTDRLSGENALLFHVGVVYHDPSNWGQMAGRLWYPDADRRRGRDPAQLRAAQRQPRRAGRQLDRRCHEAAVFDQHARDDGACKTRTAGRWCLSRTTCPACASVNFTGVREGNSCHDPICRILLSLFALW